MGDSAPHHKTPPAAFAHPGRGAEPNDPAAPLWVLLGPTASGKSELALPLAERLGAEILCMDSMQVYRGLDIGTAKPTAAERARVRHHLLDLVDARAPFTLVDWLQAARAARTEIERRGARALFVGGSGQYLAALVHGLFDGPSIDARLRLALEQAAREQGARALHARLEQVDPPSAARLHVNDTRRVIRALELYEQTGVPLSVWQRENWAERAPRAPRVLIGLDWAQDPTSDRPIERRIEAMLDQGWAQEALAIESGAGFSRSAAQALGYRDVLALAHGAIDRAECVTRVARATRQFARRQRTWFRRFPDIHWIDAPDMDRKVAQALARFAPATGS